MKFVYNNIIPFDGYVAIYLFGLLFVRKEFKGKLSKYTINHESIHDKQAKHLLFIFFYLWYLIEYLIRCVIYGFNIKKAYRNISFEREANDKRRDMGYTKTMKVFSFVKYINKTTV